jgi:hypothetical protein
MGERGEGCTEFSSKIGHAGDNNGDITSMEARRLLIRLYILYKISRVYYNWIKFRRGGYGIICTSTGIYKKLGKTDDRIF